MKSLYIAIISIYFYNLFILIFYFRKLKELNVAGNQLGALPANILKLPLLNKLLVINNFMHPVFWKDYARRQIPVIFTI